MHLFSKQFQLIYACIPLLNRNGWPILHPYLPRLPSQHRELLTVHDRFWWLGNLVEGVLHVCCNCFSHSSIIDDRIKQFHKEAALFSFIELPSVKSHLQNMQKEYKLIQLWRYDMGIVRIFSIQVELFVMTTAQTLKSWQWESSCHVHMSLSWASQFQEGDHAGRKIMKSWDKQIECVLMRFREECIPESASSEAKQLWVIWDTPFPGGLAREAP